MSVDTENIKGVFADLDDGGLTESEAIAQIRDLLHIEKAGPTKLTFRYLVQLNITVDVDGDVSDAYINLDAREPVDMDSVVDGTTGGDVDEDEYDDEVTRARTIADSAEIAAFIHYD